MTLRLGMLAALFAALSAHCSYADECDTVAAKLASQIPSFRISGRTADNETVALTLSHPDANALSLTCKKNDVHETARLTATWNATWPPPRFYDLVAAAGAILVSTTEPAIRSGAVLCAQRAMNAEGNTTVYDVNGAHFDCSTTTGIGASTRIIVSKLQPSPQ